MPDQVPVALVFNCGSTSLKFAVFRHGDDATLQQLARGKASWKAADSGATVDYQANGRDRRSGHQDEVTGPVSGVADALRWLANQRVVKPDELTVVAHRIVADGGRFDGPVRITPSILAGLEAAFVFAPLHDPPELAAVRRAAELVPASVPNVAVFDTTFHRTMPPHATLYSIPRDLADKHRIRRFGAHGLAHRWMTARYAELAGHTNHKLVTLQLGGGCSACAVRCGQSVDTTMGLTPLEGLMMSTRSGDVDPALPSMLARREGLSVDDVTTLLNKQSGLLGVSGRTSNVSDLLDEAGDGAAQLALDMYVHRIVKAVGGYFAILGGADAIIFSGGVGERVPVMRQRVCDALAWLGVCLDPGRNAEFDGSEGRISADDSPVSAWVVPADEERLIARDSLALLERDAGRAHH